MSTATGPGADPFRVLVVDDNRDAADSLALLLGRQGYQVRIAYNGPSAMREADAFRPDCLFLDLGLPGMDGFTVARRVRELPTQKPVKLIALTAYSGPEYARRAAEAGFDHYLVKPADPEEITRLLIMLREVRELAQETKELMQETKEELRETKMEIREVKEELKEVKEELKEVKEIIRKDTPDE
jgi:CheY-like chemotaxis protein